MTEPAVTTRQPPGRATTRRTLPVDGLRGVAIVLVVLFHLGGLWPADQRRPLGSFEALLQAGNVAVSVFFVISGFLVTDRLLAARRLHRVLGPLVYLERRSLRIALQVFALLLAILAVSRLDPTDVTPPSTTWRTLQAAATFTLNTYIRDHALAARSDLGPLYFLSIDMQFFIVATVVVIVLGARRRTLLALALVALAVVFWWRWHLYLDEGWFRTALTTTARIDGLLGGAAVAVALYGRPCPPWLARNATAVAGAMAGILVGVVVSCAWVDIGGYFGLQGIVATLAATGLVAALHAGAEGASFTPRALSWVPLVVMGRVSLTVFLWHMPIFQTVRRHLEDWHPLPRTLLALAVLAVIVVVLERTLVPAVEAGLRRLFAWRRISRFTA